MSTEHHLSLRFLFLIFFMVIAVAPVAPEAQKGKTIIQPVGNIGFHCQYISFSSKFFSRPPVRVFITINYGNKSSIVHDPARIWVEDVTTSRFKACVKKSGQGSEQNTTTIDWFAFQSSQPGVHHGAEGFSLFTTGTQCRQVTFPKAFSVVPKVQVTVQHGIPNQKDDAMIVWTESVSTSHFEVCLKESTAMVGPHDQIKVNWMAYEHFSSLLEAKESSDIVFPDNEVPTAATSFALCKNITFATPFFTPPVAIVTVRNGGSNKTNAACRSRCPLSSWLEEVTTTYLRVCIKDNAGYNAQRSIVIVDYLVIGDLDPCTKFNVTCKYHSYCLALSPDKYTCVCEDSCPSYEEQVCASNGRTFQNLCLLQQDICRKRGNYTKYHPGSCTGFPLQKGRHEFQNVRPWAEVQCGVIKFEPYVFYPHKKIHIQLTVNHYNYSNATFVHEATTPWAESVNSTQFTACVTRAGRNDYPSDSFATIDWVAYQGAPAGGVVGEEMFSRWWSGMSCRTVALSNGKYFRPPTILATAEHQRSSLAHDATIVWLEDVSKTSFKICLRELENFGGVHDDIIVNWLAFQSLDRPLFTEHSDINFQNTALPSKRNNFAFCQDVKCIRNYTKPPTVLLTAKHSTSGGNAAAAECNGIVSWIEFITNSGFRICAKELFVQRFDPFTVSYAVLSDVCGDGWTYFKGYCYRKVSSCDSWSGSQRTCATLGANLPSIHSQEENVYIQSLHGGEHSWLGLSDVNTEGTFVWSDGTPLDFQYWAKQQPNNFHNEDCVHTLGFLQGHKYKWDDVNCTDCHRFTCKREIDECSPSVSACDVNADCQNTAGSYVCSCKPGFAGDGKTCESLEVKATSSCAKLLVNKSSTRGIIRSSERWYYGHNMNCHWKLTSDVKMEIVFLHFKTASSADYVKVYDGESASSPLIGTFSGSTVPAPITSSSNNLYVTFKTDGSGTTEGFTATYRAVTTGTVRLMNGSTPSTGRVEIFHNDQWGTICDHGWDMNDANVVCRQLGYPQAEQAYTGATHGQGSGPLWMAHVACSGNESRISDCSHRGWGSHDCTHSGDASVKCTSVRLVDGKANYGRVEVNLNGVWGTVCDDLWDIKDARVVCRQLGYDSAFSSNRNAAYGQGSDPIWMDNVACKGGESSLLDCTHIGWGLNNCKHHEDASVVCNSKKL